MDPIKPVLPLGGVAPCGAPEISSTRAPMSLTARSTALRPRAAQPLELRGSVLRPRKIRSPVA
jgi:hypothetical protein